MRLSGGDDGANAATRRSGATVAEVAVVSWTRPETCKRGRVTPRPRRSPALEGEQTRPSKRKRRPNVGSAPARDDNQQYEPGERFGPRSVVLVVPSDSDPEVHHFRFDRIVCSDVATTPPGRLPRSWRSGHLVRDDSSAMGTRPERQRPDIRSRFRFKRSGRLQARSISANARCRSRRRSGTLTATSSRTRARPPGQQRGGR